MRPNNAKIKKALDHAYAKATAEKVPEGWYTIATIAEATGVVKSSVQRKIAAIKKLNPDGVQEEDYNIPTSIGVRAVPHYHFPD